MASVDLTAGEVMNAAAALLNDVNRTIYTYAIQIPYLNMALKELQEMYQLNSLAVVQKTSSDIIEIDAGDTEIAFNASPLPELPDDFVEPDQLWIRQRDIDPWTPMKRVQYLPHYLAGQEPQFQLFYVWQNNVIKFQAATQDNDIRMDYLAQLFTTITSDADEINVINAASFLQYRTASLLAEYVENNAPRAQNLRGDAELAVDRALGIDSRSKQTIFTRRRPFRQGYKSINRVV